MRKLHYKEILRGRFSGGNASFIPGNFFFLSNRFFLPNGLIQSTCEGDNLNYLGGNKSNIIGGSISFDKESSILATFGEFVERYCASFNSEHSEKIITNTSYSEISEKENVISFTFLKLYKDKQYTADFPYEKITKETKLDWIEGYCHFTKKAIYVPCQFVFLPYRNERKVSHWVQTSTGLAAHSSKEKAIQGGYLEVEERNAFSKWWYLQEHNNTIKYTSETIVNAFPNNEKIQRLYRNPSVEIIVYDLGELSNVETMVCFMIFTYKEKEFISVGCSSKFDKEDALIKASLEAYQGIDYSIMLYNKEGFIDGADKDFNLIDGFDKHFAFYDKFPNFRAEVPLFKDLKDNQFSEIKIFDKIKEFNIDEIRKSNSDIEHFITLDLSTEDVKSIGFQVHRVLIPGLHLLSGSHSAPFLGFFEEEKLFTEYPHPFP